MGNVTVNVAPRPRPRSERLHRPAVQLDDVPHDREPEAEAAVLARARCRPPGGSGRRRTAGTRARCPRRCRARAIVARRSPRLLDRHVDATAGGRELHGVREQVQHDLLQAPGIAAYRDGSRRVDARVETHALRVAPPAAGSRAPPRRPRRARRAASRGASLPLTMRETSSRSSISCACERAARSIDSSARVRCAVVEPSGLSRCVQPMIAFIGVRSSCERFARNSSLSRVASSAWRARAALALEGGFALHGCALAIADVEHEAHPAVAAVAEHRRAERDPDRASRPCAGTASRTARTMPLRLSSANARSLRARSSGGRQCAPVERCELLRVVAEHAQQRAVGLDDAVVLEHHDADDVRLDEAAPARFALQQPALRAVQAQQHAHDGRQLLRLQRLGEVDLRAALESDLLVVLGRRASRRSARSAPSAWPDRS